MLSDITERLEVSRGSSRPTLPPALPKLRTPSIRVVGCGRIHVIGVEVFSVAPRSYEPKHPRRRLSSKSELRPGTAPFPGHALRSRPAGRPVRGEPRALARAAICTARLHAYDRRLQYAPALAWLSLSGIDPCEACGSFVGCCLPLLLCLDCLDCLGLALCPRLWPAADVSRVHVCSQWRTMSS